MEDSDFLGYCEVHSYSPRCGFVPAHLARLCRLAGSDDAEFWENAKGVRVVECDDKYIRRRVRQARERLATGAAP